MRRCGAVMGRQGTNGYRFGGTPTAPAGVRSTGPVTGPNLKESNMKNMKTMAVMGFATLLVATTAWAGGAACSSEKGAMAEGKACKASGAKSAEMASGGKCAKGAGAMAEGKGCSLGANQMVYSFAIPTAESEDCVDAISKAAMAQAGIACVHVDLKNRVAYIITDKKIEKNVLARALTDAGYKNSYRGDSKAVRAEATKLMTVSTGGSARCNLSKSKDKV